MIIHCTKKLAEKLPDVSTTSLPESSPLGSWHAHLYRYDRRQCVLFCHDQSRYCLFVPGLVKANFADLGRLHRELFLATLAAENVSESQLNRVALALGPVQFDQKTDRSVLGSLRTGDIDLSWLIHEQHVLDCNPVEISLKLNQRPTAVMGKYLFPAKAMLAHLETLNSAMKF